MRETIELDCAAGRQATFYVRRPPARRSETGDA
jgi:hypothetical protein